MVGSGDEPCGVSAWAGARCSFYPRGRHLYDDETAAVDLFRVIEGKVRVERRAPDGRMVPATVFGPDDVFGVERLFTSGPHNECAVAMVDTRVACLDGARLQSLLRADPSVSEDLLRTLSRRVRRVSDHIVDLMSANVSARLARVLLDSAQQFGVHCDGGLRFALDLTQGQLAHLVGTSRESLNKALGDFADSGWIHVSGDVVDIVDALSLSGHVDGARRLR